jgi:hypothetical protein
MKRAIVTVLAGLALAGCGDDDEPETPTACLAGAEAYLAALEEAPGEVLIDGSTPVRDCLVEEQSGGELAQVGEAMLAAANRLNAEARRDPAGDGTVALGYLVGAVQDAASTTGGIHEDLVIRLDAAARFSGSERAFPASFERAFGAGYAAGQASG